MCLKRSLVSALILFSSLAEARVFLWPVIIKARGERSEDQSLEFKSNAFPSFGASLTLDRWLINLESSKFQKDSDSGNVSIETKYSDVTLWGGYSLFQGPIWDLYAVAGTGVYQQKVKTTVAGLSTSNGSSDRSLIGMGIEHVIFTPFNFALTSGAKLNWTQDLDPEIMPELYFKLGIGF